MIVKSYRLLLWLFIAACSASRTQTDALQGVEKYQIIAVEKFSKDIKYVFNTTRSHVLCVKETRPERPPQINVLSFLLIEAATGTIALDETIANAQAEWISESEVRVTFIPGIVKEGEQGPNGYIYNIHTQKKTGLQAKAH